MYLEGNIGEFALTCAVSKKKFTVGHSANLVINLKPQENHSSFYMYILENEFLTAKFNPLGAEWTSLISKKNGIEYIWQASPDVWPRHAPNLFPIVGKVANNSFTYQGQTYEIGQHGFARDLSFEVESASNDQLVFLLRSSPETLKLYPFDFEFRVIYYLKNDGVRIVYSVKNPSATNILWFSVGAHPAFNIPLGNGGNFSDYYIAFSDKETVGRYKIDGGLILSETSPVLKHSDILPLSKELFLEDALVFKELKSTSMTIKSHKNDHFVRMDFEGFPFFGIWTKPGFDKFLCLEPWCGIASSVGDSSELIEKEGIISLVAGNSWEREFTVSVG
jgi:galactose mutarotase-like enzyme